MNKRDKKILPWVLSPEMKEKLGKAVQGSVDGLNKNIKKSMRRHEIMKKINDIETRKFPCPVDVVNKKRSEMSEEQEIKLDGWSMELRDRCWEVYRIIEWAGKYLEDDNKKT